MLCSCLISRNLLSGLKTCKEVANYMFNDGAGMPHRSSVPNSGSEDNERADPDETVSPRRSSCNPFQSDYYLFQSIFIVYDHHQLSLIPSSVPTYRSIKLL